MTGLYVASNIKSLGAQIQLQRNIGDLGDVLTRLSTGLRINSGKDDPAGLIASELLKSDISATKQAIQNSQRANSVIAVADSALGQVSNLLNDIRVLVNASANTGAMTSDQIAANQLQVDASIDSIDRIAKTTNFQGQKLLDGSLGFQTVGGNFGHPSAALSNVQIQQANFGTADFLDVNVKLLQAASHGAIAYNGQGVSQDTVLTIGGTEGAEIFRFGAGSSNREMADAINRMSDATGVAAYVTGEAERGSVVLSSAGANNDILVTANEKGYNTGNYSFRIVQGTVNDARIVSDPIGQTPGVVEISLTSSLEATYKDFAGLFNITIDASDLSTPNTTAINMTRGTSNKVQYFETASDASGVSVTSGKSITVDNTIATGGVSNFNGWTLSVDDGRAGGNGATNWVVDLDNKTIYISEAGAVKAGTNMALAFTNALGFTVAAGDLTISEDILNGDSIKLGNGGSAGELFIQYKAGATAGEIMNMINNAPNVQATLKSGVSASDIISALPSNQTYVSGATAIANPWVSGVTSQTVIDLINSRLGDMFTASALSGGGSGGRVSYQDASEIWGDVNFDNALRFTGMDNGPRVRLSVTNSDGSAAINQQLGVRILQPSDADIRAGITTPILEIMLATDASGNSITTAKDIVDLFNRLTPAETLGVSASLLLPPGVDPNGRTWVSDGCGNETEVESCPPPRGLGIVQPTGWPGPCGTVQDDLLLLGQNQKKVDDYAYARILGDTTIAGAAAEAGATATGIIFGDTSALNGLTINFTLDERTEGFNKDTGLLTIFVPSYLVDADIKALIDSAISANWEAIRAFTGSTLLTTGAEEKVATLGTAVDEASKLRTIAAANDQTANRFTVGDANSAGGTAGKAGIGDNDPVLVIKANDKGVDMAGVKIYFVQDDTMTLLGTTGGQVAIEYNVLENGEKQLVIRGNAPAAGIGSNDLLAALQANTDFNKLFTAEATSATDNANLVNFRPLTTNKPHGITEGGYRIESEPDKNSKPNATSNGIVMIGQSDSNERLILESMRAGSAGFVKVDVTQGSFNTYDPWGMQVTYGSGTDSVVTVNGQKATTDGNNFNISNTALQMSGTVNNMFVGQTTGFTITGGGATFQLGPDVVSSQQIRVGINAVDSTTLGGASGKLYMLKGGEMADLKTNTKLADRIVQEAIGSVAFTRGSLGAIQRSTLDPNIAVLEDTVEQLSAAEALISNIDFAEASSAMARAQVLVQSSSQMLALANQFPQYAAQLLR